jgi:hypothetical protein
VTAVNGSRALERSDGATVPGRQAARAVRTVLVRQVVPDDGGDAAAGGPGTGSCTATSRTPKTFVDRYALDLGIDIEPYITAGLLCYSNPTETPGDLSVLVNLNFRLVVVDSLSEVVSRTADGSLRDGVLMKRILDVFRRMANAGAAVVIIAHGSEKVDVPGTSLGASEIRQTLTGQAVLLHEKRPFDAKTAGYSLIYIAKDRGSFAGGDSDINERAVNKVQRRLWGAMVVTPHPPELEHDNWYTTIEIEPATHAEQEPPKERKIDQAEILVIAYLNKREDSRHAS